MKIEKILVGNFTNCYLVIDGINALIVDPGFEASKIIDATKNLNVLGILITHHHADHIGALNKLLATYPVKVYENPFLKEEVINVANFNFEVIYTPGHTSDSITFYFPNINSMLVGDFLFKNDIGRTDLPTGNMLEMKNSLNKIKTYPIKTFIYPGHDETTTLENEIKYNNYLQ